MPDLFLELRDEGGTEPGITPAPLPEAGRGLFMGSADQIRADLRRVQELGAAEAILAVMPQPGPDPLGSYLAAIEQLRALAG